MKRDTYKVQVKRNGRVVMRHATSNPKLFGQDIKARWPDAVVETVGAKTTRKAATQWCNEKHRRGGTMPKKPVKTTKKGAKEERDVMGFRKKDYPIIGIVALLCLNVWAFNTNTTSTVGLLIAICVDILIAFWLYKKYWPRKAEAKSRRGKVGLHTRTTKRNAKDNELGLFGIKKRHYPVLAIAFAGIITLSAIMNRTTLLIIGAIVIDLAIGYWYYKRRRNQ